MGHEDDISLPENYASNHIMKNLPEESAIGTNLLLVQGNCLLIMDYFYDTIQLIDENVILSDNSWKMTFTANSKASLYQNDDDAPV